MEDVFISGNYAQWYRGLIRSVLFRLPKMINESPELVGYLGKPTLTNSQTLSTSFGERCPSSGQDPKLDIILTECLQPSGELS